MRFEKIEWKLIKEREGRKGKGKDKGKERGENVFRTEGWRGA